ncbi:TetR/AcrR family transcriptional regulator [Actinomadura rupiterrae]|uniref:TetR/AcrR family transcriptional regulator n=1 Tax=Actinomadura rupiterrae TaxID=559627 RepID=UPI0020A42000|nr:TetR/AcrR family transcriptional regulator [Actinomadura rupiterrae]MCP2343845.1 AcrR family transcriptional regulator [Actinomadura rupiterrae]
MARSGAKRRAGGSTDAAHDARTRLVKAAVEILQEKGFAAASAREVAARAGCSQSLVFYHFGSVVDLLLAALDSVSEARRVRYQAAVDEAGGVAELAATARTVFEEDLDRGYAAVLVEMISGASTTPGLGPEIARRIAPWRDFAAGAASRALAGSPVDGAVPPEAVAHGMVALYLGLEMLANLEGDRAPALAVFDQIDVAAALLELLGGTRSDET